MGSQWCHASEHWEKDHDGEADPSCHVHPHMRKYWVHFTMPKSSNKRTLDAFFKPPCKKVKIEDGISQNELSVRDQVSSQRPKPSSKFWQEEGGRIHLPWKISISCCKFPGTRFRKPEIFTIYNWQSYQRPTPTRSSLLSTIYPKVFGTTNLPIPSCWVTVLQSWVCY
jgi:hypothetical protein